MKVTLEHLARLREVIAPLDTAEHRRRYANLEIARAESVKDIDMRYRWDLYWFAVRQGASLPDSTNGYNNSHIDTALRSIVPALTEKDKK